MILKRLVGDMSTNVCTSVKLWNSELSKWYLFPYYENAQNIHKWMATVWSIVAACLDQRILSWPTHHYILPPILLQGHKEKEGNAAQLEDRAETRWMKR